MKVWIIMKGDNPSAVAFTETTGKEYIDAKKLEEKENNWRLFESTVIKKSKIGIQKRKYDEEHILSPCLCNGEAELHTEHRQYKTWDGPWKSGKQEYLKTVKYYWYQCEKCGNTTFKKIGGGLGWRWRHITSELKATKSWNARIRAQKAYQKKSKLKFSKVINNKSLYEVCGDGKS